MLSKKGQKKLFDSGVVAAIVSEKEGFRTYPPNEKVDMGFFGTGFAFINGCSLNRGV